MNSHGVKKKGHGRYFFGIALLLVVVAFTVRFNVLSRKKTVDSISSIHEKEGKPVEVITVEAGDMSLWCSLAGTVEGIIQYPVVSTNSIQVIDILRREGDWVNAGDIVIRLEKTAANPMLHSYERSRVLYENTLQDTRRMRNLFPEGAVSRQMLDKSEMALKIAESNLRDAREGTDLVADHAGVVMSLLVEIGEMADNGEPLAWIARTDTVRIIFQAGSRQAMALSKGQRSVWSDAGTGVSGEGIILGLDLAADPRTHLLSGEALFANPGGKLVPGLLVSFKVLVEDRKGVLRVPARCIVNIENESRVYVVSVDSGGSVRADLRKVETGLKTTDFVEIVSGLSAGDRAVIFGQARISDGDLVRVMAGGEGN